MAIMAETAVLRAPFNNSLSKPATRSRNARRLTVAMCSDSSGKKKTQIKETLLTPRFYTTDFDEMEALLDPKKKRIPNEDEFVALLGEFRMDYNQNHFVRSREFKEAADSIRGPFRKIFVEFLERSCTAEFSGFLLTFCARTPRLGEN